MICESCGHIQGVEGLRACIEKYVKFMDHGEEFDKVLSIFCDALNKVPGGSILEVGNNLGGTSLAFLDVLSQQPNFKNYQYFTVDPYAAIPYHNGAELKTDSVYTDDRYRQCMKRITDLCLDKGVHHQHFKLMSLDFINMMPSIPIYKDGCEKFFLDKFAFIYLDGSHDIEVVKKEVDFFKDRLSPGGAIVIDDLDKSRQGTMTNHLKDSGLIVGRVGFKARLSIEKGVK